MHKICSQIEIGGIIIENKIEAIKKILDQNVGIEELELIQILEDTIPDWREIFKNAAFWNEIQYMDINPMILKIFLQNAPNEVLADFLSSKTGIEKEIAGNVILNNKAQLLSCDLWKMLGKNDKIWIVSLAVSYIMSDVENIIFSTEFFESEAVPQSTISLSFDHPLWIKLKRTVDLCEDFFTYKMISEIESRKKSEKYPKKIISRNVMIDPSMLLSKEGLFEVIHFVSENRDIFSFYISKSFDQLLKDPNNDEWDIVVKFFLNKGLVDINSKRDIIEGLKEINGLIKTFNYKEEKFDQYGSLYDNLVELVDNPTIRNILFEEWIFVQNYSWLILNSKRVVEKFKQMGATSLEISNKAIEEITRLLVKKDSDEIIYITDKLKALSKIILSGCNLVSIIVPELSAVCKIYNIFVTILT